MKITAKGWERSHGGKNIVNVSLHDLQSKNKIKQNEYCLKKSKNLSGGIEVWWGANDVQFNGNYFFSMELTRKDIARLFFESWAEASVDEMLAELSIIKGLDN